MAPRPFQGSIGRHISSQDSWLLLRKCVLLWFWTHLPDFIAAGDRFIETFSGNRICDSEVWRRWEPGICESQMSSCNGPMAVPLTFCSFCSGHAQRTLRRLTQKQTLPRWQLQRFEFRSWAQKWPSYPHPVIDAPLHILKDLSVREWVLREGVLDQHDVLALVSRWARIKRLATSLIAHNSDRGRVSHVFDSALQARWCAPAAELWAHMHFANHGCAALANHPEHGI